MFIFCNGVSIILVFEMNILYFKCTLVLFVGDGVNSFIYCLILVLGVFMLYIC